MYGTVQGCLENVPKLKKYVKDVPVAGTDVATSVVEDLLVEVSDQVDAALAARYSVPFADVPGVIARIVQDLAAFKLAARYLTQITAEENKNMLAIRKDANELLNALQSGRSKIPGVASIAEPDEIEDVFSDSPDPVFDMCDPETWQDKA